MGKRVAIVVLLVLLSLSTWAPDVGRVFGHALGQPGISLNADGVVQAVNLRQAASGVRVGDRFDLSRASIDQHWRYITLRGINLAPFHPTERYAVPMLRNGIPYVATITPYPEDADNGPAVLLRVAIQAIVIALGILVLLRRPAPATWAFFIMVFCGCAPANVSIHYGPAWWRPIMAVIYWLFGWNVPGAGPRSCSPSICCITVSCRIGGASY